MTVSPALAIARELLRCPSVTPADAGALGALEHRLKQAGFATHRLVFSEPGTPDIDNLFAKIGDGRPHLVFAGHTDVVPPGDPKRWRFDPFAGEIADGKIYGRGAVDMKGGIAAFAAAAIDYVAAHGAPRGAISFLITGDEEGPAVNGTIKLLEWAARQGETFDHCIVGEPSNNEAVGDTIKIGRRGSLNGKIVVRGKQGHSAFPHRAQNPVPVVARIVAALSSHRFDEGTAHFERTNLQPTTIDVGNDTANLIPAEARARFNIRFNDAWTLDALQQRIRAVVAEAAEGAQAEVEFLRCNSLPFLTQPGAFTELVSNAAERVTGRRPELATGGGTSDARFIRNFCPVLEFGLVNRTSHAVDEHTSIEDLEQLTAVYRRVLETYFAS
jgi:succinyl-diaminopimelate desuccinylase